MLSSPTPFPVLLGSFPTHVRQELTRLLTAEPSLWVVGTTSAPEELGSLARRLRPGLVIIPESQLLQVQDLKRQHPVPVLLYSTQPPLAGALREARSLGVYDYVTALPTESAALFEWRREVKRKVQAARPTLVPTQPVPAVVRRTAAPLPPRGIVVLGGSTGGAPAVEAVLRQFPSDFPWAVLVAVHLPAQFTATLVERLRRATGLPVAAAVSGSRLEAGKVLVAPGGFNMVVQPVSNGPWLGWQTDFVSETSLDVPSVDMLMTSAARVAGRQALGVVLTGLGNDGTRGAQAIRQQGGAVVAQDAATCQVFGMPKAVIQAGHASAVLPLSSIAGYVVQHIQQQSISRLPRHSSLQPVLAR